jgi:intracellular septation protein
MKFLFDLFPVILFFAAFKYYEGRREAAASLLNDLATLTGMAGAFPPEQAPILVATVVVILATLLQIIWVRLRHGKVDGMLWASLGLIVVLGGATLFLRDETFIKWKPTVLYWLFAIVLLVSASFFGKNLIRKMLEHQVELPDAIWMRLNLAWVAFFSFMGMLNLFVAMNFPTDIWVNFKLFGGIGLMLVFILGQGMWLGKYLPEDKA